MCRMGRANKGAGEVGARMFGLILGRGNVGMAGGPKPSNSSRCGCKMVCNMGQLRSSVCGREPGTTYVSTSELRSISMSPRWPSNMTRSRLCCLASVIRALTIFSLLCLCRDPRRAEDRLLGGGSSSRRTSEASTPADAAGGAEDDAQRPIGTR